MLSGHTLSSSIFVVACALLLPFAQADPTPSIAHTDDSDIHLNLRRETSIKGPDLLARTITDTKFLPAQIGGIVGAYALSLVLVAITLLSLAKKRREHLAALAHEIEPELVFDLAQRQDDLYSPSLPPAAFGTLPDGTAADIPNFSYPSPVKTDFGIPESRPYVYPSPVSSIGAPGIDLSVDQRVVEIDRAMAQDQLEEMYKLVMEQEEAKQKGIVLETPISLPSHQRVSTTSDVSARTSTSKKEKSKPASLNLSVSSEKTQSRTSSLFSVLRSPRKKSIKGVSISSPIMTPQSSTFPQFEAQEMSTISPRQYAPPPPPPPPVPTNQVPFQPDASRTPRVISSSDISPQSVQTIDERLNSQYGAEIPSRTVSMAPSEEPLSATSYHSQVPLVANAASTGRSRPQLPSLPSSPKPGVTFQRANAPTAVRTGGTLPLRAYQPALASPTGTSQVTKQTVFERKGPLSPTTGRTPRTAGAVPYSPYQPFTPCIPVTPSLVTKEDRKRMKRMVPKTPTMEMAKSSDELW